MKSRHKINFTLKTMNISDIPLIMDLQKKVYASLPSKDIFAATSEDEFKDGILQGGAAIGAFTDDKSLIGAALYLEEGENDKNYGHCLGFKDEKLKMTGQVDSVFVDPDFRGLGLQKLLIERIESIARDRGLKFITATVSPDNKYSLNNFLSLNYKIMDEQLMYGGLRRYILLKFLE